MATLTVRKTTAQDYPAVLDFYTRMIDEMAGTDFDVLWKHDEHPSHAFLKESTEAGYTYLGFAEDGHIASALVVDRAPAEGYEKVDWQVDAPMEEVGIVHVVATLPAYHGNGFARQLMEAAIAASRADGLKVLRLDTFVDNVRSHGLYEKLGFTMVGTYPIFYDDLGTVQLDMFELAL
ncbi:MAG: GNAT family N-acetyltransferase [Eggerthellaceae bacterium]|nr:GNAT family N-acetyltransferase [Eggerthellaceae bacterium]